LRFFIKDRNQRIGAVQKVFDYKLFRDAEFLALSAWSVFSIGYVILSFSLPAYALSIGLTTQQGAIVGSMLKGSETNPLLIRYVVSLRE